MEKHLPWYQRLRRERELHGWSQEQVARIMKTDPKTVGRWERGEAFPSFKYRRKLCKLYGKNAEELGLIRENVKDTDEQHIVKSRLDQDITSPTSHVVEPASLTTFTSLMDLAPTDIIGGSPFSKFPTIPPHERVIKDADANAPVYHALSREEWRCKIR